MVGKLTTQYTLLITIFVLVYETKWGQSQSIEAKKTINEIIDSIDAGLEFILKEHRRVNFDGIIGTRIVEGQLQVLLQALRDHPTYKIDRDTWNRLEELQKKAGFTSNISIPYVRKAEQHYFYRIGPILEEGFWTLDYASRELNMSEAVGPQSDGEAMHEGDSDSCLTELFGTGNDHQGEKCRISQECWTLMTSAGFSGYSLSHQLFYFEIGQQFGCFEGKILEVADTLNARTCASMYMEAQTIAHNGFPLLRRDLFMEIPALCGMVGYRQFFHDDWLDQILNWQWNSGCWGSHRSARDEDKATDPSQRFKRVEKRLDDGCQCHKTAVAMGALVQYVRYVIEFDDNVMLR